MSVPSYTFKFGNFIFPDKYINEGGYDIKPNQRQDLDPYTDQTGLTHRNAVSHTKTDITITTRKNLKWEEVAEIMQGLTSNYINSKERDANCTYFDTESFSMKTGHFYLDPSFQTTVKHMGGRFEQLKFQFIEY